MSWIDDVSAIVDAGIQDFEKIAGAVRTNNVANTQANLTQQQISSQLTQQEWIAVALIGGVFILVIVLVARR